MTRADFEKVFLQAVKEYRRLAPKDTGNLAYNAIKYQWLDNNTFKIYVDVGDVGIVPSPGIKGQAPYMPFTNEPWISPKWNGKQNPNEGWWNDATEFIVNYIAKSLRGDLKSK